MREIKFRAWDKTTNQMHDIVIIDFFSKKIQTHPDYVHTLTFNNCELMQFTGLKDKNGKEIYEEDIFESWNNAGQKWIWTVVWNDNKMGFDFKNPKGQYEQLFGMTMLHVRDTNIQVIGNIYENPELLK